MKCMTTSSMIFDITEAGYEVYMTISSMILDITQAGYDEVYIYDYQQHDLNSVMTILY